MKHKTIEQLRDNLRKVLKRARPKQLKKLRKAYHGKRLKQWWNDYAKSDEFFNIAEMKNFEDVGHRMKGGHRQNHERNVLERKLNKSNDSRKHCHNVINRSLER